MDAKRWAEFVDFVHSIQPDEWNDVLESLLTADEAAQGLLEENERLLNAVECSSEAIEVSNARYESIAQRYESIEAELAAAQAALAEANNQHAAAMAFAQETIRLETDALFALKTELAAAQAAPAKRTELDGMVRWSDERDRLLTQRNEWHRQCCIASERIACLEDELAPLRRERDEAPIVQFALGEFCHTVVSTDPYELGVDYRILRK